MVVIQQIEWISKEGLEAQVTVTDETYRLLCFSHPFHGECGVEVVQPLFAFQVDPLYKSYEENAVEKLAGSFSYRISAVVVDKEKKIVKLGSIYIEIDSPSLEIFLKETSLFLTVRDLI